MPTPADPELYELAKEIASAIYKKPSAHKSGFIVKTYKELGGQYLDDDQPRHLSQWFAEDWKDIGNRAYPVYRPTRRVSATTPLTPAEIDPENLRQQIQLKQRIKGERNLPAFKKK